MNRASEQGVVKSNLLGYLPFKAQKKMGWGGGQKTALGDLVEEGFQSWMKNIHREFPALSNGKL